MLKRIFILIPVIILSACLEESSEKLDKKAFTKIYDNQQFNSGFIAIDMKQTPDGGYLILGGKTEVKKTGGQTNVNTPWRVYLLKTDALGNKESEVELPNGNRFAYPTGRLTQIGDSFYFFCMDDPTVGTSTYLATVDQLATIADTVPLSAALSLPLACSQDFEGTGLLLLSYDNSTQESVMTRVSVNGAVSNESRFYTGAESPIDNLVIRHVNHEGTQYPFSTGALSSNQFYFNGFRDYTFSLVFTDLSGNEDFNGVVNGQQENAGFSMVLPITSQSFAIATYNFGFNFIHPNLALSTSGTSNTTDDDIQGVAYSFPELETNARVKAIRAVVDGKNVIIFGSNTKSGQIGLYMYDEVTKEFLSSKYLGYSNPFEIAAMVQTEQGDLVVSGTTYIAGRLPRFFLIKVPENEIKK